MSFNNLLSSLLRISEDLDRLQVDWALVGGLAVAARSEPRTTKDVDIMIALPTEKESEALCRHLFELGYRAHTESQHGHQFEARDVRRLQGIRLIPPMGAAKSAVVDLLFALSGIEAEVVAEAEWLPSLIDRRLPIARTGHLLALKVLAATERKSATDEEDIFALLQHASAPDLSLARDSLRLMASRGYGQGCDLQGEFGRYLELLRDRQR